ncbi:hypothetical protein IFM89_025964 [Coptis chinensis]|uniref:KIB1-4 beta-propeller domain-containing protein n=1 Tax=Coptis chinensis TaxID=261450 RepID=A0A835MC63_9MAGN|nr:hypothetical protein IFM89_025964 [Coptis chinensis]
MGVACTSRTIYALTSQGATAVIERNHCGTLSVRLLAFEKSQTYPGTMIYRPYMVESCEEIYYVVIHHLGINNLKAIGHVEIFKMDFAKEVWVKVESLDGRNFILSDKGCMSFSATKSGTEGNIIYFTLYEDNGCLYAFGVEDGSLSVYLPCPNLKTPFFSPFWLMLSDSNRLVQVLKGKANTNPLEESQGKKINDTLGIVKENVEKPNSPNNWIDLPLDILLSITMKLPLPDTILESLRA